MTLDMTRLLTKLLPEQDGEDYLRMRTGVVADVNTDGTVDVTLSGVMVENVAVLSGAVVAEGTVVQILTYRGGLLVLGAAGPASVPAQLLSGNVNSGNATPGTTFTNTISTGVHGVAFIAPPSGQVWITGRAVARNDTANGFVLMDYEVRAGSTPGSGSVVRASDNDTAAVFESSVAGQEATLPVGGLITGLTPGGEYNTSLTYAAGTAGHVVQYNRRYIAALPQ
jgi:hypothetical protein